MDVKRIHHVYQAAATTVEAMNVIESVWNYSV